MTPLLTATDVAERYGISVATVKRAIRAQRIIAHKVGRAWLVPDTPHLARAAFRLGWMIGGAR